MESYQLEPKYSTSEIPGKCIKCLGEQELNSCLMQLLREEGTDKDVQKKYEALVAFLQSPESMELREKSEKYLADGKKVAVNISIVNGKPEYRLIVE